MSSSRQPELLKLLGLKTAYAGLSANGQQVLSKLHTGARIVSVAAKPDRDLARTGEDPAHHLDLLTAFQEPVLANTDLINPQGDIVVRVAEMPQSLM